MLALSATQTNTPRHTPPLWTTGPSVPMMALMHIARPAEEEQVENMSVRRRTVKLCVLMLSVWLVTAAARADAVLDWNTIAVNTAVANKQNPFAQARFAAIAQLAVFEAVNAITQDYRPYTGSITAPPGASADAAAIEATYKVLSTYFPASQAALDADRTNSLMAIADSQSKTDGIATGDAAAL